MFDKLLELQTGLVNLSVFMSTELTPHQRDECVRVYGEQCVEYTVDKLNAACLVRVHGDRAMPAYSGSKEPWPIIDALIKQYIKYSGNYTTGVMIGVFWTQIMPDNAKSVRLSVKSMNSAMFRAIAYFGALDAYGWGNDDHMTVLPSDTLMNMLRQFPHRNAPLVLYE